MYVPTYNSFQSFKGGLCNKENFRLQLIILFLGFYFCVKIADKVSRRNFSNLLDMRNLHQQDKKIFCCKNCSNKLFSDLKFCKFSAFSLKFTKVFSQSLEFFFLTVGHTNFDNKIPNLSLIKKDKFVLLLFNSYSEFWRENYLVSYDYTIANCFCKIQNLHVMQMSSYRKW